MQKRQLESDISHYIIVYRANEGEEQFRFDQYRGVNTEERQWVELRNTQTRDELRLSGDKAREFWSQMVSTVNRSDRVIKI